MVDVPPEAPEPIPAAGPKQEGEEEPMAMEGGDEGGMDMPVPENTAPPQVRVCGCWGC